MKQVTKDEFFATIGQLNVHPTPTGDKYPYTSIFKHPNGVEAGRIVPTTGEHDYPPQYTYHVA